MKKFYTLALLSALAASSLSARELKFFEGDKEITSGSRIEYSDFTTSAAGAGMTEVAFTPSLYIWSDMPMSVTITAKCLTGQKIQMCAGGNCEAGQTVTKENVKLGGDEKLDLKFDFITEIPSGDAIPEVVTELSAVDPDRDNVKADFTIVFSEASGVMSVLASDPSFRAVEGGIEYNFERPTVVSLFSISGETVMELNLDGSGFIPTSSLIPGIYAYKAGSKSGKIYLH